jgi:superfamily II DNA or RNA helicase
MGVSLVEEIQTTYNLRDYQVEAIEAVERALRDGLKRVVVSLPTGTGKTIIFAHWLRSRPGPSLVLVHRDELVTQAVEKLEHVIPDRRVGVVKAERDDWDADIVVASVQSLRKQRLERYQPGHFRQIVVDECHHSPAPTYRKILDYLTADAVLGVSATPYRGDRVSLTTIFDKLVYSLPFPRAVQAGWLVDFVPFRVHSSTSIAGVKTTAGDFAAGELERAVNTDERNSLIVQAWLKLSENRRTIAFAAGVEHAYGLAALFREAGVAAEAVCGETPLKERREILERLRTGQTRVVTNAMVLTEGFDSPEVGCIVVGRPTKSVGLFTQMVGRGSRPAADKNNCLVIDVADRQGRHRVVSVAELIGADFVKDGESLVKSSLRRKELLNGEVGSLIASLRNLGELEIEQLETLVEDLTDAMSLGRPYPDWRDLYDAIIEEEEVQGTWQPPDGAEIDWSTSATERQVGRLVEFGWPEKYAKKLTKGKASVVLDQIRDAMEAWAQRRAKSWGFVLDLDEWRAAQLFGELWRIAPASEKQLKFLAKLGVDAHDLALSKGEAGLLIDHLLAHKRS